MLYNFYITKICFIFNLRNKQKYYIMTQQSNTIKEGYKALEELRQENRKLRLQRIICERNFNMHAKRANQYLTKMREAAEQALKTS